MPEPTPETPQLETVADRLHKLEQALATLQTPAWPANQLGPVPSNSGPFPEGLAAGPAHSNGSLVPAAVLRAVLPVVAGAGEGGVWARMPILAELRLMVRMYFDPRYRLSRVAQFGVPVVLGLMLLSYVFFNHMFGVPFVPIVSLILERLALIVLAVALYKVLAREAARYAAVLEYLTKYGR
jgi:hypothetical protein